MYRPAQNDASSAARMALFSQRNRDTLQTTLTQDFQSRTGRPLTGKQQDRLERALDHYVEEVYSIQGDKPLGVLNREVLRVTSQDFNTYLQRQDVVRSAPTNAVQTVANDTLFQDTATRFDRIQNDRQESHATPPSMPDFRISLEEEGPTSIDLFERAKLQRESEALRIASTSTKDAMDRIDPGLQRRIQADDSFRQSAANTNRATDLALVERQNAPRTMDMPLIVLPDRRELMISSNIILEPTDNPRGLGQGNSNQTITYPHIASPQKANLQQDMIVRQESVVSYREIEHNLFLYSADRNWLFNTRENRYNFTVVFDPANNGNIQGQTQQVNKKFRNISRVELVKVILPVEGIYTFVRPVGSDLSDSTYQYNILSMPYVTVVVNELDSNNYGTDNIIDKSFGVVQYDANWYSDPNTNIDSRGYTAFIPKFLKCQKVYEPTPLSTLQKMSISLLQPNGNLISGSQDALDIINIYGAGLPATSTSIFNILDGSSQPNYFFVYTTTYFSRFQFTLGDVLRIGNFNYSQDTLDANPGLRDFTQWINTAAGHMIVGIGYLPTSGLFVDGPNGAGYANCIIIGARHIDPTTGGTGILPFGSNINIDLTNNINELATPRRIINLNRQVQLVFRIITRELDPLGQIRADNM
jgi:hypothetical protein